jgi:predicted transcriptional regulator
MNERNIVKDFLDARPAVKQRFIAQSLGVSDTMVSMWVSGQKKISQSKLEQFRVLAKEYGWNG